LTIAIFFDSLYLKGGQMKKLVMALAIMLIFSISGYAETEMQGQMGQGMMMGQGHQMPMNCPKMQQMQGHEMTMGGHKMPMMNQMMGHGMMMQDMMQMMMDIINMQEQIVNGVKASDKKVMLDKVKDMKAKMQNKMTMCHCMMGSMMGGANCPMMGGGMCPMMRGGMQGHDMMPPSSESGSKETEKAVQPKTEQHKH
jgi:hypothetical protein